jgi:hypothetical protein
MLGANTHTLYRRSSGVIAAAARTIETNIAPSNEPGLLVWKTQPDQTKPFIGAYGAACAALALASCGRARDDQILIGLAEHLIHTQGVRGGWSIRNAPDAELTTATTLAVRAIAQIPAGSLPSREDSVERAAAWLAANFRERGWPTWSGSNVVSLTATVHAMLAIRSLALDGFPHLERMFNQCVNMLLSTQHPDGYWPKPAIQNDIFREHDAASGGGVLPSGSRPAIAGTALALSGLEVAGMTASDEPVRRAFDWLVEQDTITDCNADSFYVVTRHGELSTAINYVHFTPALVLHVLSRYSAKSPSALHQDAQATLALHLLDKAGSDGYWTSELAPLQMPTWLLSDGCAALTEFASNIRRQADPIVVRDNVEQIKDFTTLHIASLHASLSESVAVIHARLDNISKSIDDLNDLTPRTTFRLIAFAERNWEFCTLAPVLILWIALSFTLQKHALAIAIIGVIATVSLAAAGIISGRRDARGRTPTIRHIDEEAQGEPS